MKRSLAPVLLFVAALLSSALAQAQSSPPPGTPFSLSSNNSVTPWLNLNGQNSCGISFAAIGSGAQVTVQGASEQPPSTPVTITSFGTSGVITPALAQQFNGSTVGTTGAALTGIRLLVTFASGPVSGYITCTNALGVGSGGSSGGGATFPPLPLAVTTAPPAVFPSPYATVSPSGALAAAPVGANGSPYPVDANGIPYTHPTAVPTTNVNCVAGGCPTPQPQLTSNPGSFVGYPPLYYGSNGGVYAGAYPDIAPTPVATTGAGIQLFASATAQQNIYLWELTVQCTATCVGMTLNFQWGTTVSTPCDTTPHSFFPSPLTGPTTALSTLNLWAGVGQAATAGGGGGAPSSVPLVIPTGNNLCVNFAVFTSGTARAFGIVTIH